MVRMMKKLKPPTMSFLWLCILSGAWCNISIFAMMWHAVDFNWFYVWLPVWLGLIGYWVAGLLLWDNGDTW